MRKLFSLSILIIVGLLAVGQAPVAVEADAVDAKGDTGKKAPVDISPKDAVEAGKAKHAFKQENPCEGMAEGDYLGPDVCADCHADKTQTMQNDPHGVSSDLHSPFGRNGCETCHGPGMMHFETEGNCIVSMTGRFGESIEQRNDVCLGCHNSGDRLHWSSSIHEAEDLACVNCHSIHKPNDVIERSSQTEVCFSCHKDIRSQVVRASSHPIRENKVTSHNDSATRLLCSS